MKLLITFWRFRHLLAGLPAILIVLLGARIAWSYWEMSPLELRDRYLQAGDRAFRRESFSAARTYYLKSLALGETSASARFNLTQCQVHLGHTAAAQVLLDLLVEDGPNGFPPVQLYRARKLLLEKDRSPANVEKALVLLELATARQPDLIEAQLLLGNVYRSQGRIMEAKKALLVAAEKKPAIHLILAQLSLERGDKDEVKRHAQLAWDHFRPMLETAVDDEASVIGCSEAYFYLEDYENAVQVLRKARSIRETEAVNQMLGNAYAAQVSALEKKNPNDTAGRIRLIAEGLRYAPNEVRLLEPLLEIRQKKVPGAAQAHATLEELLAREPSGILHLLLGLDAWKRGDQTGGRFHLERAYKWTPDLDVVSNNLACMLAKAPEPDLPRALALAEATVKRCPQQPHFRDTRGQILVKMGRYQDALDDLEFAQKTLKDNMELNEAIATAYEKLGQSAVADQYRRRPKK